MSADEGPQIETRPDPGDTTRSTRDVSKLLNWAASVLLPDRKELPWAFPIRVGVPTPRAGDAPLVVASALESLRADPTLIHLVCATADQGSLMVAAVFGNVELERLGAPPVELPSEPDLGDTSEALRAIVLELKARGWRPTAAIGP